ncbi:hypothetical protein CSC62_13970 [Pseudoxanthomonas jiangsuensis]|uniref:hypothetical protein n=1 Tax=Pseudoxanthomonas jiangsuensis TaxID=619688 RepID=UPI001391E883|nr:hypothetical protein [Pseudoxanthomonas jiangsuensis]KAF1692737.1 hypothetical protein CSC62_13970 [Pseudoxanthomonas jiangsuensis]
MAKANINDAIRDILAAADDSLQVRQVCEALRAQGIKITEAVVRAYLVERATAGEYIRGEIDGQVVYTVSPGWTPNRGCTPMEAVVRGALEVLASAQHPLSTAALKEAILKMGSVSEVDQQALANGLNYRLKRGQDQLVRVRVGKESHWSLAGTKPFTAPPAADSAAPTDDAAAPPPAAEQAASSPAAGAGDELGAWEPAPDTDPRVAPAPVQVAPSPPVADRFALRDRLTAIAGDTQDALEDACRAELPHALLLHLVAANSAAHRALLAIGR